MAVIGGADGPTAIYVTSSIPWGLVAGAIIIVAAAIGLIFWGVKKR